MLTFIGQEWKDLEPGAKNEYTEKAAKAKERYEAELAEYKVYWINKSKKAE